VELSSGAGMPIARSTGCLMGGAGCMAVYLQKDLTIGTSKVKVVPKKSASDPLRLMLTSSS